MHPSTLGLIFLVLPAIVLARTDLSGCTSSIAGPSLIWAVRCISSHPARRRTELLARRFQERASYASFWTVGVVGLRRRRRFLAVLFTRELRRTGTFDELPTLVMCAHELSSPDYLPGYGPDAATQTTATSPEATTTDSSTITSAPGTSPTAVAQTTDSESTSTSEDESESTTTSSDDSVTTSTLLDSGATLVTSTQPLSKSTITITSSHAAASSATSAVSSAAQGGTTGSSAAAVKVEGGLVGGMLAGIFGVLAVL
ncbi:hypothetical protein P7C70_g4316, partial [Phenoliferia sp. Uapishka_3]